MTTFTQRAEDYLRLRRSLGFKLQEHARLLPRFAAHLDAIGAEHVSTEIAVTWAIEPVVVAGSVVPAMRLLVARGSARYMAGIDPRTEIPPTGLIRSPRRRRAPYIYTEQEILLLMGRARTAIRQRLAAATYETLIGLLAATGMRISEAIKLDDTDIDFEHAVLFVRESKFNKSRYLPLQPSTCERCSVTCACARKSAASGKTRAFSSRCAAVASTTAQFKRRSVGSATPQASALGRGIPRGCMTCATPWPSGPFLAGIARELMLRRSCLCCRPTWGT
jgi:integrase